MTVTRAISCPCTPAVGLAWRIVGIALAVAYEISVYSRFKGNADAAAHGH